MPHTTHPRDLIVFGEDWGAHPSSTQHLIRNLPGGAKTLWINSIGLRRPRATLADARRAAAKLTASLRRPAGDAQRRPQTPTPAGMTLLQPLVLPMAQSRPLRALNRALLARTIRPAASKAGLRRPILWTSLPSAADALGALDESAVVYYCGDDFAALTGVDHQAAARMEAEIAARADLILAASETLAARFPAHKTHLLPHGVDYDLFAQAAPRAADLPQGRPIAGLYGAIAPWIDTGLLDQLAQTLPDWLFVLIGPMQTDPGRLPQRENVRILGPRPHHELPSYSQHWTASLIPFHDTPQIHACNPLKLREYLAAGRPVISTDFPALAPYRHTIHVTAGAAGFAAALRQAANEPAHAAHARRLLVAQESWAARAAHVHSLLQTLPQ